MKKFELENLRKQLNFIEGGTKDTCLKIFEFLSNITDPQQSLKVEGSAVEPEEFVIEVCRLITYISDKADEAIVDYFCKSGCRYEGEVACPGNCLYIINAKSKRECPCFNLSQEEIENLAKALDKHPLG